jgi:hypothetical protein
MAANPFTSTWIFNTTTGEIKHVSMWTWTTDYSWRGVWIPFDSQKQAQAYAKAHPVNAHDPINKIAGGIISGDPGQVASAAPRVDVPGILSALSQPNTWLRVAEAALGIVLIVAGIVRLTPATRNIAAIGKVAALL